MSETQIPTTLCECGLPAWDHFKGRGKALRLGVECQAFRPAAAPAGAPRTRRPDQDQDQDEIGRIPGETTKAPIETIADEDAEMVAFFEWAKRMEGKIPEMRLVHHVPNGGHRHPRVAMQLKRMGVKPGIPDIEIPVPRRGFTGAHVEMKRTKGGRLEDEQRKVLLALQEQGRFVFEAKGWDIARNVTLWYFEQGPWPGSGNEPRGPWTRKAKA